MIKQFIHKGFSVMLALLVLFSTVSFTIEKHFCGDVLVDVSVFSEAQKCGMVANEMPKEGVSKKTCCKDEIQIVKGQSELITTSVENLNLQHQFFISNFIYAFVNLFEGLPQHIIPHKDYSPPNLVANIQVLDQVFLI